MASVAANDESAVDGSTTTRLRLRSLHDGWYVDAPEINGVKIMSCTGLTLTVDGHGIPKLRLEVDVSDLDVELPCEVNVIRTILKPRRRYSWRRQFSRAERASGIV